jgi:hypothetical protein
MKKVFRDKIINIDEQTFDSIFLFDLLIPDYQNFTKREVIFIGDLLEKKRNEDIVQKIDKFPAMWSEVYSPKDELEIFKNLFDMALKENKKIHIVGITLKEEIDILEAYYEELGFMREDINCFDVDFSIPLITCSCYIENIMWRGSDYKRLGKSIFRNPPIREAGQVKALFKGINRGVIAGLAIEKMSDEIKDFLQNQLLEEHILALTLGKILSYNLQDIGFFGKIEELKIKF